MFNRIFKQQFLLWRLSCTKSGIQAAQNYAVLIGSGFELCFINVSVEQRVTHKQKIRVTCVSNLDQLSTIRQAMTPATHQLIAAK